MVRRLFWVCLPSLLSQVSLANDAAWNCQQDKNSKEWVCVGDKKPHEPAMLPQSVDESTSKSSKTNNIVPVEKRLEPITEPPSAIVAPVKRSEPPPIKPIVNAVQPSKPAIVKQVVEPKSTPISPVVEEKPVPIADVAKEAPTLSKPTDTAGVVEQAPAAANAVQPSEPAIVKQAVEPKSTPISPVVEEKPTAITEPVLPITTETVKANPATASNPVKTTGDDKAAQKPPTPGWHCGAGNEAKGWDCQLVGVDPKGKPQAVSSESDGFGFRLLDPVFDHQEESIFSTLNSRFPQDPWANCSIDSSPQRKKATDKKVREESPLDMTSNYSEVFDNQVGSYFGNVDMSRADQRASSQAAHYDTVSEILDLHGNVFYSEDEIGIYTDSATLKLASEEARLRDTLFILPTTPIRGRAKVIYRDNAFLSRYRDTTYTTCKPGNQDWAVHASELKTNKETGKGAAKNAWVEFKGFPVFYSPYLSFPIDDRRMTGFLAPVFGNTRSNGFDISTPFYWNLAPNYDVTFRPRYLLERGIMLGGDFRYLTESSQGELNAEFLPNDGKLAGNTRIANTPVSENPNYGKSRYQFSFNNTTHFTPKISSNMDLNYVSDSNYFSDLGNSLSFSNFRFIKSNADLKYIDDGISLTGQVVSYQKVDPLLVGRSIPYRKLPQINLTLDHAFKGLGLPVYAQLDSEFIYFQHDVDTSVVTGKDVVLPEGQRFDIKPSVTMPWKTDYAYITPKLSLQYTGYLLDNQVRKSVDANGKSTLNSIDSVSRTLPILSVDSGLYFERDLDFAGTSLRHTLEPRLFYLYIPRTNQKDIPLFDSNVSDFRYNTMFRENRFSGTDRVQDANQITLALTSRLLDPANGLERLKVNIGNILYLQNRDVVLSYLDANGVDKPYRPEKTAFNHQTFSNLITEVSSQFNEHFSADAGLQWNPRTNKIERGNIGLHFVNNPGELINLGFQFRKDDAKCRLSEEVVRHLAGQPVSGGCESIHPTNPTADELADPNNPNNPNNPANTSNVILSDASFRWPLYDDWYGIGRWQYSWVYDRTQEAFLGLEKENCCWRFRIIGRRYFNGLTNPSAVSGSVSSFNLATAEAQTGVFFQIELKGLTGFGQKLDDFFERNIYGYQKPEK